MSELVQLTEHDKAEYILLTPQYLPPREGQNHGLFLTYRDIPAVLNSISESRIVALDFETKGGDYSEDIQIVGLGLAWDEGSGYFDWTSLSEQNRDFLIGSLIEHPGLIAHNVYFDGGVIKKLYGQHAKWHTCTYSLYSMLANEGVPGRYWGLKVAQTELLLWENSNEAELDEWLVVNGHYKGNKRLDTSPEYLKQEYLSGKLKPEKGEMWRAPPEILGKYCILDAESCYLLYMGILEPAVMRFPGLMEFVDKYWMILITTLIDQKIHGILMDREGLVSRKNELSADILRLEHDFLNHPQVSKPIKELERGMHDELRARAPARLKKNGKISKNWSKWRDQLDLAMRGQLKDYKFNMNSGLQLRELLYGSLGLKVDIVTESGDPAASTKAFSKMGEIGKLLTSRAELTKELSYIDKYLELTETRDTIHPSFRTPGTSTGRLSSKEPNLQQVPKSKAMMSLFKARPGHVWVDLDFAALESVVAAEFSQDPNLLALYGDNVPENDIHLFIAASVPGRMGDKVRATGYTPINPPKGTVAKAKKEAKHERSVAKTVVYACQFGAGVKKVMETLEADNIYLGFDEVKEIHTTYWNTFAGLKDYSRGLFYEWRRNKGYVMNGFGRPMALPQEFEKDVLSRFIQSTGHDTLCVYISIIVRLLNESGIPWKPVIIDWHDSSTVEVPEAYGKRVMDIFNEGMVELNGFLRGIIRMRGTPTMGYNMSDCKEPEN